MLELGTGLFRIGSAHVLTYTEVFGEGVVSTSTYTSNTTREIAPKIPHTTLLHVRHTLDMSVERLCCWLSHLTVVPEVLHPQLVQHHQVSPLVKAKPRISCLQLTTLAAPLWGTLTATTVLYWLSTIPALHILVGYASTHKRTVWRHLSCNRTSTGRYSVMWR